MHCLTLLCITECTISLPLWWCSPRTDIPTPTASKTQDCNAHPDTAAEILSPEHPLGPSSSPPPQLLSTAKTLFLLPVYIAVQMPTNNHYIHFPFPLSFIKTSVQKKKKPTLNSSTTPVRATVTYGKYADIVSLCICLSAATHCPWSSTKPIPTVKVQFKSGWTISSSQHITFSEASSHQTTVLQMQRLFKKESNYWFYSKCWYQMNRKLFHTQCSGKIKKKRNQ